MKKNIMFYLLICITFSIYAQDSNETIEPISELEQLIIDIQSKVDIEKRFDFSRTSTKEKQLADLKKINSLFSNLSSLTVFKLIELRKSYKTLNYSLVDIDSHFYRVISYPIYLTLITIFSCVIMFNIGYQKTSFFKIVLGIFLSVIIYYVNYFLNILGTNEKIPLVLSIFMPLIILSIINFTSIIRINEK